MKWRKTRRKGALPKWWDWQSDWRSIQGRTLGGKEHIEWFSNCWSQVC